MSRRYRGGFITANPVAPTIYAASGSWTLDQQMRAQAANTWPPQPAAPSQQAYTTAGTYSWTAPAGVTSVCVVCVGGGCYGGGGGGLGWKNNIPVIPGQSYTVVVGVGGTSGSVAGGDSYFSSSTLVLGGGAPNTGLGGSYTGDGGGNGGRVWAYGSGGGAGGYSGNGGRGGSNGAGGGGGGGAGNGDSGGGGGGGGVGILGEGASGDAGTYEIYQNAGGGGGGSGGSAGGYQSEGSGGGLYGGGGGNNSDSGGAYSSGNGGRGAVRIIWGTGRAFPSTNTGNV